MKQKKLYGKSVVNILDIDTIEQAYQTLREWRRNRPARTEKSPLNIPVKQIREELGYGDDEGIYRV